MSIPVAKQYVLDFEQLGFGMFVRWGIGEYDINYKSLGVHVANVN